MPSPPSARSLERRREKAARFPRTGSVLQTGYIPLHFAALPTLPRNNPEITSLPVCANAAQTGMAGRPRPRFAHEARRSRRYGVSRRIGVFAPCGSGPDQPKPHVQLRLWLRSMRERSRLCRRRFFAPSGTERAVRLPCRGECPGKGRIQKKTASSGASGRAVTASVRPCPAKRAFASVMDNGAFCACSATVPVARPLGREREFDGGPGHVPVVPAAWGAFQTQQGFASPRPALFPVDLAVGEE